MSAFGSSPKLLVSRLLLAFLFGAASISKFMGGQFGASGSSLFSFLGLFEGIGHFSVAIVEAALAVGLLSRIWKDAGLFAFWVLALFSCISLVAWVLGSRSTACGCFGGLEVPYSSHFLLLMGGIMLSHSLLRNSPSAGENVGS